MHLWGKHGDADVLPTGAKGGVRFLVRTIGFLLGVRVPEAGGSGGLARPLHPHSGCRLRLQTTGLVRSAERGCMCVCMYTLY